MKAAVEFKVEDLWIGLYWRRMRSPLCGLTAGKRYRLVDRERVDVWICVLPCLPVHLWWWRDCDRRGLLSRAWRRILVWLPWQSP